MTTSPLFKAFSIVLLSSYVGGAAAMVPLPESHLSAPVRQPWSAVKRTATQTEWRAATIQTNTVTGRVHVHTNKFIQLSAGLNVRDAAGNFVAADPSFQITTNGAQANATAHKLSIPSDIGAGDGIRVTMPDGQIATFQPLAIDYYDPVDGGVILLDVVTNAVGWLTASNEIVFSNCFTSIRASIRIRNFASGYEQDLLLHERPPDPVSLGLSAATRHRRPRWTRCN